MPSRSSCTASWTPPRRGTSSRRTSPTRGCVCSRPTFAVSATAHERHRATSPFPFFAASYCAFASRITCPVLFVDGGPEGLALPDDATRKAAFLRAAGKVEASFGGAGHMMHWTRGGDVAARLVEF